MLVNLIAIFAASALVLVGRLVAGRLVGLATTAICSAAMAFFLMPPVYSLRVSQPSDLIALVFYSTVGLVLAKSAPSRARDVVIRDEPIQHVTPHAQLEADVRAAMAELLTSDLGGRLIAAGIEVEVAPVELPCRAGDALRILTDVVTAALRGPEIRRISVYGSKRPGVQRLVIAAHRVWPPPLYTVIITGKRDENCEPAVFQGWPSHWRATWFDNGYDRVYQVSLEVVGETPKHQSQLSRS